MRSPSALGPGGGAEWAITLVTLILTVLVRLRGVIEPFVITGVSRVLYAEISTDVHGKTLHTASEAKPVSVSYLRGSVPFSALRT